MKVTVIGAGNGGAAAAVELTLAGHDVALHGRSAATVEPFLRNGIRYEGVFGEGRVTPSRITSDLKEAIENSDVAVVTLPTFALGSVARDLHRAGWDARRPVVLNPGHTGGAFEFDTAFREVSPTIPPIAEFATLAYVARKPAPDAINITGRARKLRGAALKGGDAAMEAATVLFPGSYDCGDVVASDLCNVNMVVHPPGAMLGASWVEATGGDFTFYVQGLTSGVVRVMEELDRERIAVGKAFGHDLPTVIGEMKAIGTVPSDAEEGDYRAIAAGEANKRIKAPDSLGHRYFTEDFTHGLVPFLVLAEIAGVETRTTRALVDLHGAMVAGLPKPAPRDARSMGLVGATMASLRARLGK
ncbi:NAD/NADP octopine/nopaline dehydrogenase family protein [Ancylobacter oerskovii]|uniref:2-dehydropantoate 2-reductase n=1 Tax=Ancylobacter oerskovii TaxID=459519 RepID=A0ABW4YU84_9HYPH|nr:NAD/NADP octopine/nopaline dehydrogenase family protein [Ancylobacter oerskovii]MBS7544619.1 NAD/NADP octopine/nopaline dehydrogenase family protein [Ancylobacter oerskovii]